MESQWVVLKCEVQMHYESYQEVSLQVGQHQNPHQCQSEVNFKSRRSYLSFLTFIRRMCSGPVVLFWSQENGLNLRGCTKWAPARRIWNESLVCFVWQLDLLKKNPCCIPHFSCSQINITTVVGEQKFPQPENAFFFFFEGRSLSFSSLSYSPKWTVCYV